MNFLQQIAQKFYTEYGNELYQHTFVFPNRRAGLFFQKYLSEIAGKPLFSPSIVTIQELFEQLSVYQSADKIEMLVTLHKLYGRISKKNESFDDFLFWGEMLLHDFNEVDKYLVDAKQLFKNINDLRSSDDLSSYLTSEQIEAIRQFWNDFLLRIDENNTKKTFLETWEILFELYSAFRTELQKKGQVYEGMMYREVTQKAKNREELTVRSSFFVFVGLNALTRSEAVLLDYLKSRGIADFYWDYDVALVRDEHNKASLWIADNLKRFPSKFDLKSTETTKEKPTIELIGIPSGVGQAKQTTTILSQLIESGAIPNSAEPINTAIVLPDEKLLLPVLYSIPEEIEKINVTMGYGLSNALVTSLVEHIAHLQQHVRKTGEEQGFYFRFVLSILNHQLVAKSARQEVESLKTHILKNNLIVVSEQELHINHLFSILFKPIHHWKELGEYLKTILSNLYNLLTDEKSSAITDDEMFNARPIDLEREFLVQFYQTIVRLEDTLYEAGEMSIQTYFRLLKRLVQGISVSFSGEPLSGLQIMGVLETRALDFDNLIILSMNEGIFPSKTTTNSFIPYSLRKAFSLPTHEHQDSIYAYHFYRMISRAKRLFLLYDTRNDEMQTGEVSRYFYQLKYLYGNLFDISERIISYDVQASKRISISVAKTAEILRKLDEFKTGNQKSFSPSSLNTYINCPLQFYLSKIEGFKEEDEVREEIESAVFGSMYHEVMENIFNRLKDATIVPDALSAIAKDDHFITDCIEKAFARHHFKDDRKKQSLKGQNYLVGEMIRNYIKQTLKVDKTFTPFEYISSEYAFNHPYRVNDSLSVNIRGTIDRIDRVNGTIRVIDYKSGTGDTKFRNMEQLFDGSVMNRPKNVLQVFMYALIYLLEHKTHPVSPAIYYLRLMYKDFKPIVKCTENNEEVVDFSTYLPDFVEKLNELLEQIFDPNVPFSQTQNEKNCEWCAFKEVCGR